MDIREKNGFLEIRVLCKGKNRCLPIDFICLQSSIIGKKIAPRFQLKAGIRKLFIKNPKEQTFCVKGKKVNILGFAGHMVSIASI